MGTLAGHRSCLGPGRYEPRVTAPQALERVGVGTHPRARIPAVTLAFGVLAALADSPSPSRCFVLRPMPWQAGLLPGAVARCARSTDGVHTGCAPSRPRSSPFFYFFEV